MSNFPLPTPAQQSESNLAHSERIGPEMSDRKVCWTKHGVNGAVLVDDPYNKLLPGMYYHFEGASGKLVTSRLTLEASDRLLDLPGLPTSFILDQIESFWSKAAEYERFGFAHKRGILLYGPPGCGKTSVTSLLKRQIIERDGVVFIASHGFSTLTRGLSEFRQIEPNRPVMTLVEDLESYFPHSNGSNVGSEETVALALYDGERQFNNIIHVATTNKPDLLADRFIRRPGRFDLVIGIHAPSRETREAYLKKVCNGHLDVEQLNMLVEKTEGLGLSVLRELASTYLILGISLEESLVRLRGDSTRDYRKVQTGFTVGFM